MSDPSALARLADACGVAVEYTDAAGRRRRVPSETVTAVLTAMGHDVRGNDPALLLQRLEDERWRRLLPPSIVMRGRQPFSIDVFVPADGRPRGHVMLETGEHHPLDGPAPIRLGGTRRTVDGVELVSATLPLPTDLPWGYHRLILETSDRTAEATLLVAPERCPFPAQLRAGWGWMLQLYALRSQDSWGFGDLADLRRLARWSAHEGGAGFLLINPLHAVAPVVPQEPSPYYPSTRRFTNPLYLRVEEVPEYSALAPAARERVEALGARLRETNHRDDIDRDDVFRAKLEAFELLAAVPRSPGRNEAYAMFLREQGVALRDFATYCMLAERHGVPFQNWPEPLRHPRNPAVGEAREKAADRVDLHMWLQFLCDEQLSRAQDAARVAGMPIGVIHDLAVGVDRGGADSWALQDHLAMTMSVGAPPDPFNQQGQNWEQPPLLPGALEASGLRPFRDMLTSVLRHAGGIRIDHILGLFRLYWIPRGAPASEGTYVRYPAQAMLGVLALEAHRAQAMVVGEDLGTVGEGVRDAMRDSGILGSSVLYFEQDAHGHPRSRSEYPVDVLASVNTHDLPTAAGWLTGTALQTQIALDLLDPGADEEEEVAAQAGARAELEGLLRAEGYRSGADATLEERITALYAFLAATPSRLVAAAIADAVGDMRQPNMPGTVDAYPNWRLPIAEPDSDSPKPVLLDDLLSHPRVERLVAALKAARSTA